MQAQEIQAEQARVSTSLDNLKPLEAALWEIALQVALSNESIDKLAARIDRLLANSLGRRS